MADYQPVGHAANAQTPEELKGFLRPACGEKVAARPDKAEGLSERKPYTLFLVPLYPSVPISSR